MSSAPTEDEFEDEQQTQNLQQQTGSGEDKTKPQTKLKFDDSKPESLEDAQSKSPEQKLRVLQQKSSGISRRYRLSEFVSGLFSEGPKMDPQQVAPEQTSREQYLKIAEDTLCFEVFGLLERYDWFDLLLDELISCKLRLSHVPASIHLNEWNREVATQAGRSFAATLLTHSVSENGVAEWIMQCEGLRELDQAEKSFRPLVEAIGQAVLSRSAWGVSLRAFADASISMADLASDLVMMFTFFSDEKTTSYGYSTLLMISVCFGLQTIMIVVNKYGGGFKVLGVELSILLSGCKPAFDAYAVASGAQRKHYATFDPFTEMTGARIIELFAENIPMSILQILSIIDQGSVSSTVLISLIISCLCAGFSSASVTLDYDVSPSNRVGEKDFYGFIPDSATRRFLMLTLLIFQSALLLVIRSTAFAFLILLGSRYVWLFVACDLGLYLLCKVARKDFLYWAPVKGTMGVFCAFIMRSIIKCVTDFTGIMQFRHPQELGGMYWTFNMFVAISTSVGTMELYLNSLGEDEEQDDEFASIVRMTVIGCVAGWVLVFLASLLSMKKGYLNTFYDSRTAAEFKLDQWKQELDDATRVMCVKGVNPPLLRLIDDEEIVEFFKKRTQWEADAVDFWNDECEAYIDVRYLK
ncbi:hypothetical protein TL16_g01592 [Triparma laevis f. inornata]|uniref:Uncharacterized protein n=1 Tax=Triparma laevis f. inornata TaxID=1714386 RepID=A0A9W6ZN54_9STRA|nr:hypothetical protein TL16_g01592 [Triparma laevis f. inornata]